MATILAVVAATSAIPVASTWHDVFDVGNFNVKPVFDGMFVHGGPSATGSRELSSGRLVETCTGLEHLGPWPLVLLLVTAALASLAARASPG